MTKKFEMAIEITSGAARPSDCTDTPGAWDVSVELEIGGPTGRTVAGEVTLVPRAYDGKLASWGDMDHWMSGDLCAIARDLTRDGCRDFCEAVESEARDCVTDTMADEEVRS